MSWYNSGRGNPCARKGVKDAAKKMTGVSKASSEIDNRHKYVSVDRQNVASPGELFILTTDCDIEHGSIDALVKRRDGKFKAGTLAVFAREDRVSERTRYVKELETLRQIYLIEGLYLVVYNANTVLKKV